MGLCCARSLAQRGVDVVLVERDTCGRGASLGNAGWITPALSAPLPAPGVVRHALTWMARPDSPFWIRPRFDLHLGLWLWRFWRNSNRHRHLEGLRAMIAFAEPTFALYDELQRELGFEMHEGGLTFVVRDPRHIDEYVGLLDDATRAGYPANAQVVGPSELTDFEPALLPTLAGAVHLANERHVRPEDFTARLASHLRVRGVEVLEQANVTEFLVRSSSVRGVRTQADEIAADAVVIAAGVWSRELAGMLGFALPLEGAKGYGITGARGSIVPKRALYLTEARLGVSPFDGGLRLAGTLEFAGIDLRVHARRVDALRRAAALYLRPEALLKGGEKWAGLRPLLPDGLPAVGQIPGWENVYLATGHGMLGITLAPATGEAIADTVMVGALPTHLESLDPWRFARSSTHRKEEAWPRRRSSPLGLRHRLRPTRR